MRHVLQHNGLGLVSLYVLMQLGYTVYLLTLFYRYILNGGNEVMDRAIESDSRRIQQVLVNLLTNACKHTVQGEIHLHLSTTETPGRLTFSVTDTGDGIPVGQAKEIFKRYKKANNLVQGSGLGLHICCTIARKLGAEIKLDESYKDGARFLMIL